MNLFLKLILAHLIADFILQFEELYQLKIKSKLGHFFHAAIHILISLLLALPYLRHSWMAPLIVTLCVIHYFQDSIKYALQDKHPAHAFTIFLVDQFVHVLFISAVLQLPVSYEAIGFPHHPRLHQIYTDTHLTLFAIAFISSAFAGGYFLHSLRKNLIPESRPRHFITSREMSFGLAERTGVTCIFLLLPVAAWPLSITIPALRLALPAEFKNKLDAVLNFVFAAAVGLLFRHGFYGVS